MPQFTNDSIGFSSIHTNKEVNDLQDIEGIVYTYYTQLYRLAISILEDPEDAKDAVQDGLISALRNLDNFRREANLKTWLYSILVNTYRSFLRKRKARRVLSNALQVLQKSKPDKDVLEGSVSERETYTQLWRVVNALNEKHRIPIILRYVHELSISEIAQVLGLKEGTIHSRLHYARHKIKVELVRVDVFQSDSQKKVK
ncbi:MAG: RNA polymerase sigma factor [Chloroflexota bacterium]